MKVPFYKHQLGELEIEAFTSAINSEILTTGDKVFDFESKFSKLLKVKHCIALQSCTAGLHLSLEAYEFEEGSEVITTPLTYVATALAIIQARLKPVFCDVEESTGNIDLEKIEKYITQKTVAIMPVHLYGQMVNIQKLKQISSKYNLICIEDAAHCVEGQRDGYGPAMESDAACFSFYATKNLTCGEGGCVATNSDDLAKKLKLLRSHGVSKIAFDRYKEGYSHWDLTKLGWKYNLDNLHASILLPQLPLIEKKLKNRETFAKIYEAELKSIEEIKIPKVDKDIKHARHLFPIRVPRKKRDDLIKFLKNKNIGTVVNYRSLNKYQELMKKSLFDEYSFVNAEKFGDEVLSLPLYPQITDAEINYVIDNIKNFFGKN